MNYQHQVAVLRLYGLERLHQATPEVWPWGHRYERTPNPIIPQITVDEWLPNMPDFEKDHAAAVKLAERVCGRIRALQYVGHQWYVLDLFTGHGPETVGSGETPGAALLSFLESSPMPRPDAGGVK